VRLEDSQTGWPRAAATLIVAVALAACAPGRPSAPPPPALVVVPVATGSGVSTDPAPVPASAFEAAPPPAAVADVTRLSDTEYEIKSAIIDDILERQERLMRTARIVRKNGAIVGLEVHVEHAPQLAALGFRSGDVVTGIDEFSMDTPEHTLAAYARLRMSNALTVHLIRSGEALAITYRVTDR